MAGPLLEFRADEVAAETEEFTPECVVYMIAFGTGNPEVDGHSFNFSRSFDDDSGVCTVREIQRATVYEGILSFNLNRDGLQCLFESDAAREIGYLELRVSFQISDEKWNQLESTAKKVFRDRTYFTSGG